MFFGVEKYDLIYKERENKRQSSLNREDRKENVKDIFKLNKSEVERLKADLREKENIRILLVDDIFTTGATIKEARKTLEEENIFNISSFVIAKAADISKEKINMNIGRYMYIHIKQKGMQKRLELRKDEYNKSKLK